MKYIKEYKILNEFYCNKSSKENIFYSFFTTGLLFWVKKMLFYIQETVNLVLICADLTSEEKNWIRKTGREYIFLENHVDDTVIWNLLFEINEYNFGWIDIDCFVFDSNLFKICTIFPEEKFFVNAVWSWKSDFGLNYYNTYFIFISILALQQIRKKISIYPNKYIYCKDTCTESNLYVISNEHIKLLNSFIPEGYYPGNILTGNILPFFDTLLFYETIAQKLGYKGRKIAPLRSDIQQKYFSNQVLHVGDSSMFSRVERNSKFVGENYKLYLEISFVLLYQSVDFLPKGYMNTFINVKNELNKMDINENKAFDDLYKYLLSNNVCDKKIKTLLS